MTTASSAQIRGTPRGGTQRTAEDWVRDLGEIPLNRILLTPPPGTATEAELLRLLEVDKQLCELVDGTLVEKPVGLYESQIAMALAFFLMEFVAPRRLGSISGEAGPLRLGPGIVRLPDIAFIARERFAGKLPLESIPSIAPDLAVEILSPSNTRREIERKLREYFAAGTRLAWIIDPPSRTAKAYTSADQFIPVEADGKLDGRDVLPGFELPLPTLFRRVDEMMEIWNPPPAQ